MVLNGNDPVILASQNKEKEGLPSLAVTRGRFVYHFATPENKAAFEKDPKAYEVQANVMCARMGASVGFSPINYSVYKGKIYLFGSGDCREAFGMRRTNSSRFRKSLLRARPPSKSARRS